MGDVSIIGYDSSVDKKQSKAALRRRWKDPAFLSRLGIARDSAPLPEQLNSVDLRGVPNLGNGVPLWHFRICSVSARDLDLSFGDGALSVWHGRVFDSLFRDFKFDGASSFIESEFNGCDFG
ncbi:MAG: hypothetical protein AAFY60_22560, partial [Myxococcota bacterium]